MLSAVLLADTSTIAIIVAIAGPRSAATPNTVCDCRLAVAIAMAIAVADLHYSCSIIINNANTSAIKTNANTTPAITAITTTTTSFPSLHHTHFRVVEGLSWILFCDCDCHCQWSCCCCSIYYLLMAILR